MKFGVIIVTYNRKKLLEECLNCILNQSIPFSHICVVDNRSTDGTREYLDEFARTFSRQQTRFLCFHLESNIGGAGGFAFGMEKLSASDCDWVLIIDDDAMIERTYIEHLKNAIETTDYLAYSGTVTTNGSIDITHRRRLKSPVFMTYSPVKKQTYQRDTFEYDVSTFCGLLIKNSLIREIGLPKTEYFIWFDDTEYCLRFHKQSPILNVNKAVLNHKTAPFGTGPVISWKNYYGFRNSIDIGRSYSSAPALYMAYILFNHSAHILIDSLGLILGSKRSLRRYRIQIYKDVLRGRKNRPAGPDKRYPPGSGPR